MGGRRPARPGAGPRPGPRRSPPFPAAGELDRRGPATMRRLPWALLLPLQLVLLVVTRASEAPVSAPRSLVWGPGLQAGVVLPVRYFYLQAVSSEGQNLTRSPPGSVQPRASLAPLPAPLRPRCASSPRPHLPRLRGVPPLACCVALPRVWSPPLPSIAPPQSGEGVATKVC